MNRQLIEDLCDAAVRTGTAWGVLAARLLRGGITVLESAAVAQGEARWILSRGEHVLSPEEQAVFQRYDLHNVGFYLAALSIENLLRGLWIRRKGRAASGLSRPPILSRHKLAPLANAAGLTVTKEEGDLLDELSELIAWHARHPAPEEAHRRGEYMSAGPQVRRFHTGDSTLSADLPWPEALERLFERLHNALTATPG